MQRLKKGLHLAPKIKWKCATDALITLKFALISTLKIQPVLEPQPVFPNERHWRPFWVWISCVTCCSFCACIAQHIMFDWLFVLFYVFYKNVLPARMGRMVANGAFMQKFENGFFWLLKETENVKLWGVKSRCGRPCGFRNLLAIAERAAMAPLGCEFCMQSVLPFVLFLFNTPFLITFTPFLITFFQKMLVAAAANTFL